MGLEWTVIPLIAMTEASILDWGICLYSALRRNFASVSFPAPRRSLKAFDKVDNGQEAEGEISKHHSRSGRHGARDRSG